jgi:hypothetical protein
VLYLRPYQLVYVKSIKTASTSVELALETLIRPDSRPSTPFTELDGSLIGFRGRDPAEDPQHGSARFCWNHMPLAQIRERIGHEAFTDCLKVSSLRNPYEQVISAFHFFTPFKVADAVAALAEGRPERIRQRFAEYVLEGEAPLYNGDEHFSLDGQLAIHHFVRLESLISDLSIVLDRIGAGDRWQELVAGLRHCKNSRRRETPLERRHYYDAASLERVNQRLGPWFAYGGYSRWSGGDLGG